MSEYEQAAVRIDAINASIDTCGEWAIMARKYAARDAAIQAIASGNLDHDECVRLARLARGVVVDVVETKGG